MNQERPQCRCKVYHRDTYRYSGRGPSGFTMHYNEEQCKRKPKENGYCWQHQRYALHPADALRERLSGEVREGAD